MDKDMSEWRRKRKIVRMPGVKLTPASVAASTLEMAKGGLVKNLVVAIEWQDGSVNVDWSLMPMSSAAWISKHVERWMLKMLDGSVELD